MLDKITRKDNPRQKKNFHPTDFNKSGLELWLGFKGIAPTNPAEWYDRVKWGAGEGAELEILQALKDSNIVDEYYDQDFDGRIDYETDGILITGFMDAWALENYPIEIKTINNKNSFDISNYQNGKPRENYVGQLSIYMEAKGVEKGVLLVVSVDGLHRFWIECNKVGDREYQCGNIRVNLQDEINRWKRVLELTTQDTPPEELVWEKRYKYSLEEMDWDRVSANEISKARNGHKVLGDWEVLYSPWKDLIVNLQGEKLGYSDEELAYIKEKTKGYSSRKK